MIAIRLGLLGVGGLTLALTGTLVREAVVDAAAEPPERLESSIAAMQDPGPAYDSRYHFVRMQFSSGGRGGFGGFGRRGREPMWAHDWPRAERNFLAILSETTGVDTDRQAANVLSFADDEIFKHPILYMVEPGGWNPTDDEVANLRAHLMKGGFLIVDDFRGFRAYDNLVYQLERALPELSVVELDGSERIFDSFFRVNPDDVIPPYGFERPVYYGIYEDNDPTKRLMVIINANNDIAEYWEYSDRGWTQIDLANEAYKLGVNYVIYGMVH